MNCLLDFLYIKLNRNALLIKKAENVSGTKLCIHGTFSTSSMILKCVTQIALYSNLKIGSI